jgi:hypothetical protein
MCYCNPSFDVRQTCWVKNKDFKRCPVRCETTYWRIMNDSDYYNMIEENGFDSIKKKILTITGLNENDWKSIKEFYDEDEDEDNE